LQSCSYLAHHFDGANWHLPHRDVAFVAISRAPLPKLRSLQERLAGVSSGSRRNPEDFNFDYHVSSPRRKSKKTKVYYNYATGEFISDELPGLERVL